ncbi:hypothetical protein GU926_03870 [Nibribacter ruber]|uniref:Uncharacterized protein n=1 Tax=Nibribacter ruber TaxID=2698458 RepID=A0A6P1P008_9BACT|nr:Imm50 family immunity protein [Nibribacter ruber]QHL86623.1 hypothetical protein GU926_03870 [Nibribacter ruber]
MEFKEEQEIENAAAVVNHFGYWPSFHDSEVLSIKFERSLEMGMPTVEMKVYAFEMTDKVIDGYYEMVKFCIIDFLFIDLQTSDIQDFNHQNAVLGLDFVKEGEDLKCEIHAAYGVDGQLTSRKIRVVSVEHIEK